MSDFELSLIPPPGYETWGRVEWFWYCGQMPDSPACDDMPSFFGSANPPCDTLNPLPS
jgi:hypothetical protein